jgi:hypothetical protein
MHEPGVGELGGGFFPCAASSRHELSGRAAGHKCDTIFPVTQVTPKQTMHMKKLATLSILTISLTFHSSVVPCV